MSAIKKQTGESATIVYLRGIAAFGVVLYHVREDLWVGWRAMQSSPNTSFFDSAAAWLSIPTPFLGSGVILFFLLSGFCISLPYVGDNGRNFRLGEYATRRFFRIYPPYLIALLFTFLIETVLVTSRLVAAPPFSSYNAYIFHIFMIQNYTTGSLSANGALWTLPVELELYIFFPLVLLVLNKWGNIALIAITGLVSDIALAYFLTGTYWLVTNFAMYWIIWCSGVVLAKEYTNGTLRKPSVWLVATALVALTIAVILQVRGVPSAYLAFLFGYFYLLLLWLGITTESNWNSRLPAGIVKPLTVLGTCSFSLYLLHKPIFRLCGILWTEYFGSKPVNFFIPLGFSLLMVLLAWLFYVVIEAPTHAWAKKLSRRKQTARIVSLNDSIRS